MQWKNNIQKCNQIHGNCFGFVEERTWGEFNFVLVNTGIERTFMYVPEKIEEVNRSIITTRFSIAFLQSNNWIHLLHTYS
jgi:hypothetical protein